MKRLFSNSRILSSLHDLFLPHRKDLETQMFDKLIRNPQVTVNYPCL